MNFDEAYAQFEQDRENQKTDIDDSSWCEQCNHWAEVDCDCELCQTILEAYEY